MRSALLLVVALLSSGCISALADSPTQLPDPTESEAPSGPGAGSPAAHGPAQRTESPVTVTMGPDGYVAAKDVTVSNDFGGAPASRLALDTVNGAVTAKAWDQGGYQMVAHLEGRGATEQEARAALDTLVVVNQDVLSGSLLELGLKVEFRDPPKPVPNPSPIPLPDVSLTGLRRSASIVAALPAGPAYDLRAESTNGGVRTEGLHGPKLTLDSTNGALHASGAWDKATLDTTNGAIHLDGVFNDLAVDSTNGAIGGTVASQRSCKQVFDTTNGSIGVRVKDEGNGYAFRAESTNGRVSIDVAGAQASGTDEQEAKTPGFDREAVQVRVEADSTNGSISFKSA